jgi:hypothetical protein
MQIPDEIRKSVCFILYKSNGNLQLAGTGFFVSIPSSVHPQGQFIYLVTAKHVIAAVQSRSQDQLVWLRINKTDGTYTLKSVPINLWNYSEDSSVDIAVVPVTLHKKDELDYSLISISIAATDDIIKQQSIGVGADLFLPGLFVNHAGKTKNIPIVRTGAIAAMPEEPIETASGNMEAYLIEARSIGGLSGSPVFVFLPSGRIINQKLQFDPPSMYWLGVMQGHWDVLSASTDTVVFDNSSQQRVNMGIGIVVPVQKVLAILENRGFVKQRTDADAKALKEMKFSAK